MEDAEEAKDASALNASGTDVMGGCFSGPAGGVEDAGEDFGDGATNLLEITGTSSSPTNLYDV